MGEWLTAQEVAEKLKVNPETVKRWLRSGEMVGVNLSDRAGWRIDADEVDRFMRDKLETQQLEAQQKGKAAA